MFFVQLLTLWLKREKEKERAYFTINIYLFQNNKYSTTIPSLYLLLSLLLFPHPCVPFFTFTHAHKTEKVKNGGKRLKKGGKKENGGKIF